MSSTTVERLLDQMSYSLDTSSGYSDELLNYLETLTGDTSDEDKITAIKELRKTFAKFTMSLADLRDDNSNAIESYNTKNKLGPLANVAKSRLSISVNEKGDPSTLLAYLDEINEAQNLNLEHINLIGRLSSSLSATLPLGQGENVEDDTLKHILDGYTAEDDNEGTDVLKSKLLNWIDTLKMEKAKYSLENQHVLRDTLKSLTAEVTRWKKNYESIEGMMFGDNPNSISQMLRKVEMLRPQLYNDSNCCQDSDVEMN